MTGCGQHRLLKTVSVYLFDPEAFVKILPKHTKVVIKRRYNEISNIGVELRNINSFDLKASWLLATYIKDRIS